MNPYSIAGAGTEVFLGAIFNDVNGTQDYDWLSAPGNYSELLSNLSTLGVGNKSLTCLSVSEEIRAVDCDKVMPVTICMRGRQNKLMVSCIIGHLIIELNNAHPLSCLNLVHDAFYVC